MSITSMISSMQAIAGMHDSQAVMFGANQARLGLANYAKPDMTSRDILTLSKKDKQLTFQGQIAAWKNQIYQEMYEQALRMQRAERRMKERLKDAGAIFV